MTRKIIQLFILMVGLLSTSGAWATTYYIDWVNGSDTNNGITKSTPWKRAPGMIGCSDACATYQTNHPNPKATTSAGDQFIFKGGETWPNTVFAWLWDYGSGTEAKPIYFGVDQTWYTGGAWTRPIFDAEGAAVTSNRGITNTMAKLYLHWGVLDNIEFKGMIQIGNNYVFMASVGKAVSPDWTTKFEVKNCYFHGWSYDEDATIDGSVVLTSPYHAVTDMNVKIHHNVFDGSDTTKDFMTAYKGSAGHIYNNYFADLQNGFIGIYSGYVWGNTFKNIATTADMDESAHHQSFENNTGWTIFYNNFIDTSAGGGTVLAYSIDNYKDYFFNNVSIGDNNQTLQLGTMNGGSVTLKTGVGHELHVFNNTFEVNASQSIRAIPVTPLSAAALRPIMSVKNNHTIGKSGYEEVDLGVGIKNGVEEAGKIASNNLGYTHAEATSAGYVTGDPPYYPTTGAAATIDAGADLSDVCASIPSSGPSLAGSACLYDTALGVDYDSTTHTVTYPKQTPILRGIGGQWDIGAYEFGKVDPL